ncbi:TrmB family transcriptional regulator [Victivallis vadensis]|uniref:TrmB family transcriptional regulator n=1 Tax=Victivallis vadensis TaxID=172901 RepID=UPI0023F39B6A|nr:helix-turn-helix domain-containing protein [Victivallis vadensis]
MSCLEQLTRLGLNGRQTNVYIALLQLGTASAIEIAKATRYKHPTVYDVLDVLKERRLVAESFSGGRKLFTAEDPENLLEEENRRRQALDAVLPDLKALYDQQAHRPRVRFYQGEEAYRAINRQLLNVKSGEYFYFGSVQEMFQFCTPRDHEEYVKERVRRGIRSYAIRVRSREVDWDYMRPGEQNLRQVRYLPRNIFEDVASLYLFDDTVAVMSALKENYSMSIESRELFTLLKTIWNCMWETAEE